MANLAVLGTLDTRGAVHGFLVEALKARGHEVVLVDIGLLGSPQIVPNVSRGTLLERTGLEESVLDTERDRAAAVMERSVGAFLSRLCLEGRLDGLLSVGGRCGAKLMARAVSGLPMGLPCVLVSHLAPDVLRGEAGCKDIAFVRSLVEVDALNRVTRPVLERAAGALCGMVELDLRTLRSVDRHLIAVSCFGCSNTAVERANKLLREAGYDVVNFWEKGVGGRLMDSAIAGGSVLGVLDLSLTDLADEVVGGLYGCGSRRMEAAAKRALPTVVVPGSVDTTHFELDAVPAEFWGRSLLAQEGIVLMRTSVEENRRIGAVLAEKLNRFLGPVTVCLPLRGLSPLGAPGQPFHDPEADFALIETLRENLREGVRVLRMAASSDDAPFIEACVEELFRNMARRERDRDFLRRIEFFRGASELLLSDAVRFTESRVVGAGEYLFRAGAPVDALFVLVSGTLEVREGGERRGKLGAGAVCGEDAFVSGAFGELEVRTLESCEVLRLRRSGVEQLRRRYPNFNARFLAAREALLPG